MRQVEESSPFDEVNLILLAEKEAEEQAKQPPPPPPTPEPSSTGRYPLVKIFNLQGDLLYITTTVQLQSLVKKDWFQQQLIMNVYWYDTAGQATDAKARMIDRESPKWNVRKY